MMTKQLSESSIPVPMDRQAEALAVLYEISRTLAGGWEMVPMIARVLALLDRRLGLGHGMLILFDPQTDDLAIEVAHGLTQEERARGRYQIGEGITGAVFKDGKPLLIPDLSREPRFLNRTIQRDCDFALYRERNLVERFFNKVKHFRAIATRYDKLARNYFAAVQLVSAIILLN